MKGRKNQEKKKSSWCLSRSTLDRSVVGMVALLLSLQLFFFMREVLYGASPVDLIQNRDDYDGWKWDMVELNSADSAELVSLPGIGPYFAKQILLYREKLWGCYADISQLMDIRGIDPEKFSRLEERVYVEPSSVRRIDLWTLSADSLAAHPYIGSYAAKGIVRFRKFCKRDSLSVDMLVKEGVLPLQKAKRLKLYTDMQK